MAQKITLFEDKNLKSDGDLVLNIGAPGERHLKSAASVIQNASQELMKMPEAMNGSVMQYGATLGSPFYRSELAKFLSEKYNSPVKQENVMLTAGATHGLHLVATTLLAQNAVVFIEDPTYFLAINLLRDDLGMQVVPVSTDKEGIDVEDFERKVVEHKNKSSWKTSTKHPFWAICYLIPTYNNPQGSCLIKERCQHMIEIARKYNILIFCDDVYNILKYSPGAAPPRLLTYDKTSDADFKGNVISNGTFSKLFSPGVRVGWIETCDKLINYFHERSVLISGGAVNHWTSQVVAKALQSGILQGHLDTMISDLGERKEAMCEVLKETLPEGSSFIHPEGGYFIWIHLPEYMDSMKILEEAETVYRVKFVPGPRCSPSAGFRNCIRLAYAWCEKDVLIHATQKLCKVIHNHIKN